jgi:2-iminobutanoate/2-iminopropanoate deaminase
MSRTPIRTEHAPAAAGPYSQAIVSNGLVFSAGQIPLVPGTGKLIEGGIREQTQQVLSNLSAILEAAGSSLHNAVKVTVYLQDLGDFAAMNEVYATFFNDPAPARSTLQAAKLPLGALVEIDVIAVV